MIRQWQKPKGKIIKLLAKRHACQRGGTIRTGTGSSPIKSSRLRGIGVSLLKKTPIALMLDLFAKKKKNVLGVFQTCTKSNYMTSRYLLRNVWLN